MSDGWNRLTKTERVVVQLTARGLSNRQIGELMHISPRTVQRHLYEVFRKVRVSTRTQLATEALRRGLADGDGDESAQTSAGGTRT